MRNVALVAGLCLAFASSAHAQSSSAASSSASSNGNSAASSSPAMNEDRCRTVHLKPGERIPLGSDTTVSSAPGGVSSSTSAGGMSSHTQAGNGAASTSTSTSDDRTVVTSSNGDCTIYIHPEARSR